MAGIYRTYKTVKAENFNTVSNEELIESYIPLVLSIAKKFPRKYIGSEDAIGIGLLELTRCVNEGERHTQAEFTTYVQKNVYRKIRLFCRNYYNHSVVRSKDLKIEPIVSRSLENTDDVYQKDINSSIVDFRDFIESIIMKPLERIIIERIILEGGYGVNEIADNEGVSHQYVSKIKESLFKRLLCELQK